MTLLGDCHFTLRWGLPGDRRQTRGGNDIEKGMNAGEMTQWTTTAAARALEGEMQVNCDDSMNELVALQQEQQSTQKIGSDNTMRMRQETTDTDVFAIDLLRVALMPLVVMRWHQLQSKRKSNGGAGNLPMTLMKAGHMRPNVRLSDTHTHGAPSNTSAHSYRQADKPTGALWMSRKEKEREAVSQLRMLVANRFWARRECTLSKAAVQELQ